MKEEELRELRVLWDYMRLDQPVQPGGCIVGFGCINDDIALRCAQLYREGYASRVLFTGGLGRNTLGRWVQTEAERFAAIAAREGVPPERILLEKRSTNSEENIRFTRALLERHGLAEERLICVHKPFMERRLYAAMQKHWPEARACYTSPRLSPEEYLRRTVAQGLTEREGVEVVVGDFQRMEVYARLGYQIPQDIPEEARRAFRRLVELGYTGQLIREEGSAEG